jgi:hypothetical protein
LSAAIAVAGGGSFLGWKVGGRAKGGDWRVLYVDGEMHIADIQERARLLLDAVPDVDQSKVGHNLNFLARQHQEPDAGFPSITEGDGTAFILKAARETPFDLIVLDNFSTLGQVEDENAASSCNSIQAFLLALKVNGVSTMLVLGNVNNLPRVSNTPKGKLPAGVNGSQTRRTATKDTMCEAFCIIFPGAPTTGVAKAAIGRSWGDVK